MSIRPKTLQPDCESDYFIRPTGKPGDHITNCESASLYNQLVNQPNVEMSVWGI